MKKRIVISTMVVTLVCMLIGGATFAVFTSQATTDSSTISAGTVEITVRRDMGDPVPGPMFYTTKEEGKFGSGSLPNWPTGQWYPGKTETRALIVKNSGSLNAVLDGVSAQVSNINDPNVAQEFAQSMNVRIVPLGVTNVVLYDGTLSGLTAGKVAASNSLPITVGGEWYLNFTVTMDIEAGNNLQGLSPKVAFSIYASQNN